LRTTVGILVGAAFVALVAWVTFQQIRVHCEVCVEHRGRQLCEDASAATRDESIMQARSAACSRLSSGVTDGIACNGSPPLSVSCQE
jgi:hypothetical protein